MTALGLVDIFAGVSLLVPNFLGFYMGIAMLLKGLSSMLSLTEGNLMIVAMGLLDIAAGAMLVFGFSLPWFWLIIVLKGVYSIIAGLGG